MFYQDGFDWINIIVIPGIILSTLFFVSQMIRINDYLSGIIIFTFNIMIIIFEFGILFHHNGIKSKSILIPVTFKDCIYYSVITFCSLGHSDFLLSEKSQIIANIEEILGFIIMSLLIILIGTVLFRKNRR